MTLAAFPEKIPETEKIIFYFSVWASHNGAPNPTDQYQQLGSQKCIIISHLKSTAYRNKISLKLGYRAINARKYVRCARTFYYISINLYS